MGGGIHRLTRQIPEKLAMGRLLTGRRIHAQEACTVGFVNQVVAADQPMKTVDAWLADIRAGTPLALRVTKQVARRNLDYPALEEALQGEYPTVDVMIASEDAIEGTLAFAEKREPKWKGM